MAGVLCVVLLGIFLSITLHEMIHMVDWLTTGGTVRHFGFGGPGTPCGTRAFMCVIGEGPYHPTERLAYSFQAVFVVLWMDLALNGLVPPLAQKRAPF